MNRLEVREQILMCQACELHTRCTAPVPFKGPTPSDIVVMGEAPGRQEDLAGEPFVGKAGGVLYKQLKEVGFVNPDELMFANTNSCFPTTKEGKGRAPSPDEIKACSPNRIAQLELAQAKFCILTGNVPLQAFRPDLRIGRAHGRPFKRGPVVFFPIYHPAGVLRNPRWNDDVIADLHKFVKMIQAENWHDFIDLSCVTCGCAVEDMQKLRLDRDGIAYCEKCWIRTPEGRAELDE